VEEATQPDRGATSKGHLASRISTAVVRVFADFVGRGPTKAKAIISREVIAVVLENTLTKGEHRLVEQGRSEAVETYRRVYQRTMRDELVTTIESLTGRTVIAFLSDHCVDPDVAVEIFILAPEAGASSQFFDEEAIEDGRVEGS
jgi:uncharacterized protein YbcI